VVFAVNEKPHIQAPCSSQGQALERAQGWLKLPNGKAVTGFNHEYKRHGTTTLFAALEDHRPGQSRSLPPPPARRVLALHEPRRRRASGPRDSRDLRQSQHSQAETRSLAHPPQERPASFYPDARLMALNQVEVWFSILSTTALAGASLTSPRQVRDQIDAFIAAYNQDAHPFAWTKLNCILTTPTR
jgi:hypothetical protein